MADPHGDGWKARVLPGFIGLIGPLWTRREGEAWAYGFVAEERHGNPAGLVHGGMICTLLDHALSVIAWEANVRRPCVTVALDVKFLASARPGDFLTVRGQIDRQTASLVFLHGGIAVGDEKIAAGSAVLKVL